MSAILGSIHAFSVFLTPLEVKFGATRAAVSLAYSMGLIALTFAVLVGPRIYGRWSAATIMFLACGVAALGAMIAGFATSLPLVWLGYSLVFGLANGVGYGFGLQLSAQVSPGHEGLAMGIVTAAYALGATVAPILFTGAMAQGGFLFTMVMLAIALLCIGALSAVLLRCANIWFQVEPTEAVKTIPLDRNQALLCLGYFGSVLASLMVIGHAAGIAANLRPDLSAWTAPMLIAICNLLGSLLSGRLADHMNLPRLLAGLALLTAGSLAMVTLLNDSLLIGFAIVGFAYGGTIAAYPAAIAKLYGMVDGPRIYGRVFTAWGAAGLAGPWLAAALYDARGTYQIALIFAAVIALFSMGIILLLFNVSFFDKK